MLISDIDTLERVLLEIPSCIFFKDTECRYVFATHYWKHLNSGGDENWSIVGKTDLEIRKDKENAQKAYEADKRIIETGESTEYVIREETDGVVEYLQLIKRPVRNADGTIIGIVGLINDVTKQVELEQKLSSYMEILKVESETDPLTKICNRRSGSNLIEMRNKPGMFCLFDVDDFKGINDNYGHDVGDEVLVEIAKVMTASFRGSDILIRLGGDEFAIYVTDVENEETAVPVIDRFFKKFRAISIPALKERKITISMGICFTDSDEPFKNFYKKADETMYDCKKNRGGNCYGFYAE